MKNLIQLKPFTLLLATIFAAHLAFAHDHLSAGATATTNGATLIFQNDGDFGGDTGFVFNLTPGTTNDAYLGYYYTGDLVFEALPATPDNGGPAPGAAALGAFIQVKLLGIEGPAGANFGFWETTQDGVDSTNLTWTVPVPLNNGTNLIRVSEGDGGSGSDPYGHLHGRIYSFDRPGLYKVTWQFVDTSTNGPNGGPVDLPSGPFYLYYQADVTTGSIIVVTNTANVTFAAPSNIPDSGVGPSTNYQLLSSASVGPDALWQPAGPLVVGDDHLHTLSLPMGGTPLFFQLKTE